MKVRRNRVKRRIRNKVNALGFHHGRNTTPGRAVSNCPTLLRIRHHKKALFTCNHSSQAMASTRSCDPACFFITPRFPTLPNTCIHASTKSTSGIQMCETHNCIIQSNHLSVHYSHPHRTLPSTHIPSLPHSLSTASESLPPSRSGRHCSLHSLPVATNRLRYPSPPPLCRMPLVRLPMTLASSDPTSRQPRHRLAKPCRQLLLLLRLPCPA